LVLIALIPNLEGAILLGRHFQPLPLADLVDVGEERVGRIVVFAGGTE
jgi:hypothetical protein